MYASKMIPKVRPILLFHAKHEYLRTYIRTYVSNVYIQGNDGVHDLIHYYICMHKEKIHSTCTYILTCVHITH